MSLLCSPVEIVLGLVLLYRIVGYASLRSSLNMPWVMLTCLHSARQQKGIMVHLDSSASCRCIAVQYFNLVELIVFLEFTNKLQVATIRESWATWRLSSAVLRDSCKLGWLIPEWSNGCGKQNFHFWGAISISDIRVTALSVAVSVLSLKNVFFCYFFSCEYRWNHCSPPATDLRIWSL